MHTSMRTFLKYWCIVQEVGFLRDFGVYANNLGTAASMQHANLTSWTWRVFLSDPVRLSA